MNLTNYKLHPPPWDRAEALHAHAPGQCIFRSEPLPALPQFLLQTFTIKGSAAGTPQDMLTFRILRAKNGTLIYDAERWWSLRAWRRQLAAVTYHLQQVEEAHENHGKTGPLKPPPGITQL